MSSHPLKLSTDLGMAGYTPSSVKSIRFWLPALVTSLLLLIWVFVYLVYCQLSGGGQVDANVLVFVCLCCCALTCSSLLLLLAVIIILIIGSSSSRQSSSVDYLPDEHRYEEVGLNHACPALTSNSSTPFPTTLAPVCPPPLPWRRTALGSSLPLSLVVSPGSEGSSPGSLQSTADRAGEETYGFTQSGLKVWE